MNSVSIRYALKYQLSFAPEYKWSENKECFNTKTNRKIKKTINSRCVGYHIRGKFYSLNNLREFLEKIKISETPF